MASFVIATNEVNYNVGFFDTVERKFKIFEPHPKTAEGKIAAMAQTNYLNGGGGSDQNLQRIRVVSTQTS